MANFSPFGDEILMPGEVAGQERLGTPLGGLAKRTIFP
jgi:hypothetical protein